MSAAAEPRSVTATPGLGHEEQRSAIDRPIAAQAAVTPSLPHRRRSEVTPALIAVSEMRRSRSWQSEDEDQARAGFYFLSMSCHLHASRRIGSNSGRLSRCLWLMNRCELTGYVRSKTHPFVPGVHPGPAIAEERRVLVIGDVSVPDLVTTSMDVGLVNEGHQAKYHPC